MHGRKWTDRADALLKVLLAEGKTPAEIGDVMGRTGAAIESRLCVLREHETIKRRIAAAAKGCRTAQQARDRIPPKPRGYSPREVGEAEKRPADPESRLILAMHAEGVLTVEMF